MSTDCEARMYNVVSLLDGLARLTPGLIKSESAFGMPSLRMPRFIPAELGFLRLVSWLYAVYHETARADIEFICGRLSAYELDPTGQLQMHPEAIRQLRTFLQHNVDPDMPKDRRLQEDCKTWFRKNCKTSEPCADGEWTQCLTAILEEAIKFLSTVQTCIRRIEQDESGDRIIYEWQVSRKRSRAPHEFDCLISTIAADMGRDGLDPVRLRRRFYERWSRQLDLLSGNFEFEVEARKLIEHTLLSETTPVLPLTGKDIMVEFGIAPGPEVGRILQRASTIYIANPCSRQDLIERLREGGCSATA